MTPAETSLLLHADLRTYLGSMVRMTADEPHYRFIRAPKQEGILVDLEIRLPTSLAHASFSVVKRQMLGEALDRFFVEQFCAFVHGVYLLTGNEQKAVESFLDAYKIDPREWDYEAARKRWRDHREKVLYRPEVSIGGQHIDLSEYRTAS